MQDDRVLDAASLSRLRELVGQLARQDLSSVPFDRLVELATELKLDAGLTLDLNSGDAPGPPLVVVRLPEQPAVSSRFNDLSRREREVAALIVQGLSNKEIAGRLFIAEATVKDHVHHILRKTRLPNRAAIASNFHA